jgi:hypothetical protein
MFLDVFCKSSGRSLAVLYYTERKPDKGKEKCSELQMFLKKLSRNLRKKRSAGCILYVPEVEDVS